MPASYNANEGHADELIIEFPKGTYVLPVRRASERGSSSCRARRSARRKPATERDADCSSASTIPSPVRRHRLCDSSERGVPAWDIGPQHPSGPGFAALNISASRVFRVAERQTAQVRMEGFNSLNHGNFWPPNVLINAVNGGTISSAIPTRSLHFGTCYSF